MSALAEARALGFLGPGPVDDHVAHALAFLTLWPTGTGRALDLGSGGGVPGLVLAAALPAWTWTLVDNNRRRTSFLKRAVASVGLGERVEVVRCDAVELAHDPAYRASFRVVTARSFGPPGVTAEVGGAFIDVGGVLLVAEPPEEDPARWPAAPLAALGLAVDVRREEPAMVSLRRVAPVGDDVPSENAMRRRVRF